MPAIPEFLLRKLYVPDSLNPFAEGFTFELNNSLAPVTLTGMGIISDGIPVDVGFIYLSLPGLGEIPAGGVSEEKPFSLAINVPIQVRVYGQTPHKRLVIRAETKEAGVLQFGITLSSQLEEQPEEQEKPVKKAGFLSKMSRRLQYATQVFKVQQDSQHPSFHFAPPSNWMNDPNGLIYWKGNYHVFYQYNPFEPAWGNIHWGHAISKDMLHWKHLSIALWPDPQYADAGGCFSGCAVNNNGVPTLLYTGVYPETQCLATSSDDDLVRWKKNPQPVIPEPPPGMPLEGFRDPCVWWEASEWRMALGTGIKGVGGAVFLYRSRDLITWQYIGILAQGHRQAGELIDTGTMWECPSFFPLDDKWVLILSICAPEGVLHTIYYTGQYIVNQFIPDGPPRLVDGGAGACFYAPQTFLERRGKRAIIGWLRESRSAGDQAVAGWSGTLTIPRILSLSEKGELCSRPVDDLKNLRREHERLTRANPVSQTVSGASIEMMVYIPPDIEKWSGVALIGGPDGDDDVLIGVDCISSSLVVDCRHADGLISIVPVEMPGVEDLKLHVFVDGSVIEVFVEDKYPVSARFYMKKPQALRVRLVGDTSADIWKLKI